MNGPGTWQFARDDTTVARQPSLYQVPSAYVVSAQDAAAQSSLMITAMTAALALAVIWYVGKMK